MKPDAGHSQAHHTRSLYFCSSTFPVSGSLCANKSRMTKRAEDTDAFSRIYKKTEFDYLLIKIGGWSRFQHIQWLLLFLAAVPQAWYTYAPAFAAAKPKEGQIYCVGKPEVRGESFCAAWQNGTCQEAGYRVPYSSIVTDVSLCLFTALYGTLLQSYSLELFFCNFSLYRVCKLQTADILQHPSKKHEKVEGDGIWIFIERRI